MVEEAVVNEQVDTPAAAAACDQVLRALRRRMVEVEAWADGAVKDVAQEAVREEVARIGRQRTELEWRWA
jgi:Glu-tRNA(Gln) amidotransferase subunit E-like FAD-binding protein